MRAVLTILAARAVSPLWVCRVGVMLVADEALVGVVVAGGVLLVGSCSLAFG